MATLKQIISTVAAILFSLSPQVSSLPSNSQLASVAPSDGLVGYWNFDEGSGTTANDSSGNRNTGTITGATWTTGKIGSGALMFDGKDDKVVVPSSQSLNPSQISISFWVKIISAPSDNNSSIIEKNGTAGYRVRCGGYTPCAPQFVFGGSPRSNGENLSLNTWTHVAIVGDNNGTKVFINGAPGSIDTNPYSANASVGDLLIGSGSSFNNINEALDEVRIYNRALTNQEILDIYNSAGGSSSVVQSTTGSTNTTSSESSATVNNNVAVTESSPSASTEEDSTQSGENPVAQIRIKPSTNVEVGEEVYFDASGTTDNKVLAHFSPEPTDNFLLPVGRFEWDFGDGYAFKYGWKGNQAWSSGGDSGTAVTHFFMKPGTYPVTLTVTDTDGNKDTETINVTVTGEAPVSGFELWHASFNARTAQYIYAQIPASYRNNSTRLKVTLTGNNGYSENLFDKNNLSAEEIFLLRNANLSAGNYVVQAELLTSNGGHISVIREKFSKSYSGAPKVGINENNALVMNGKLFFPVTPFLLDVGSFPQWSQAKYINTLHSVGYYPDSMSYPDRLKDYLNQGASKNWLVVAPERWEGKGLLHEERYSNVTKMESLVVANKNHPALLAWLWDDEPNMGGRYSEITGQVCRAWTYLTNLNDDQHPVAVNLYGFDYLPHYTASDGTPFYSESYNFRNNAKYFGKRVSVFDITGLDNYPYEYRDHAGYLNSSLGIIDQHLTSIDNLISNEYNLIPVWDFVESQDIRAARGTPAITPKQILMLAWADVIHGAKGINWFEYFEKTPAENFSAMEKFLDQVTRLTDVVLGPVPSRTASDNSNVRANRVDTMVRETNTDIWIFAVRVTEPETEWAELGGAAFEPETINTSITISGLNGNAGAEVYDENRSVAVTNGVITDSFARESVHIYRIPKTGTPVVVSQSDSSGSSNSNSNSNSNSSSGGSSSSGSHTGSSSSNSSSANSSNSSSNNPQSQNSANNSGNKNPNGSVTSSSHSSYGTSRSAIVTNRQTIGTSQKIGQNYSVQKSIAYSFPFKSSSSGNISTSESTTSSPEYIEVEVPKKLSIIEFLRDSILKILAQIKNGARSTFGKVNL